MLPFEDMSANPEYAYFAPGMHDEILNQLAKLQNLNVIARTSVMQYAGAARPITEIAGELNVATIMEGSVSYAEGRVAIRTQLIDAGTGVHLWSESCNREFSNVFEIQADIAMNVANAIEAEFSLEEQEAIEKQPTESTAAYALYLKAVATGYSGALTWAADIDQALQIDPDFALAHATKAVLTALSTVDWPPEAEETVIESSTRALVRRTIRRNGDTLIVNTTHVDWPYWSELPVPQSDQASYLERFSISDGGRMLHHSITITYPVVFAEPFTIERTREWTPGVELLVRECVDWSD